MAKGTPSRIFKIRRTTDDLYSNGGMSPGFDAKGKAWTTMGGLKNHLNLLLGRNGQVRSEVYRHCEVITVELTPKIIDVTPMDQVLTDRRKQAEDKQQRIKDQAAEAQRQRELAELNRLQQKYGTK